MALAWTMRSDACEWASVIEVAASLNCCSEGARSLTVDKNIQTKFEAALRLVALNDFLPTVKGTINISECILNLKGYVLQILIAW